MQQPTRPEQGANGPAQHRIDAPHPAPLRAAGLRDVVGLREGQFKIFSACYDLQMRTDPCLTGIFMRRLFPEFGKHRFEPRYDATIQEYAIRGGGRADRDEVLLIGAYPTTRETCSGP